MESALQQPDSLHRRSNLIAAKMALTSQGSIVMDVPEEFYFFHTYMLMFFDVLKR
jgi:hypothetical protein